jgi:2-polyprenyl-3-methyl-5-hydroxy-6-metoxy-1,4-benzoquinol methylase
MIYDNYTTNIQADKLDHKAQILRVSGFFNKNLIQELCKISKIKNDIKIIEIGAGWGKNLLALKSLGFTNVHGVDISEEQVQLSQNLGLNTVSLSGSAQDLLSIFGSDSVDCILLIDILEHLTIDDLYLYAQSINKILKKNGLIVIQVPNDLAPFSSIRSGDLTHYRAFNNESINQFVQLCGLNLIYQKGVAFPGSGAKYKARMTVSKFIYFFIKLLSYFLYGKDGFKSPLEPNLWAVAEKK